MTPDEIRDLKHDLDVASMNFRELLNQQAAKLMLHSENAQAGGLLVFERIVYQHAGNALHWYAAAAPMAAPDDKPTQRAAGGKRAPKGQGAHRHKFNAQGFCDLKGPNGTICGTTRQRAPKGSAARPDAKGRTIPLPTLNSHQTIGEHAPDKFDGGTFGSSGTSDRR